MNYTWFYVLCINPEHKVAGFMPRLTGRARANYRLKNACGVWYIRRAKLVRSDDVVYTDTDSIKYVGECVHSYYEIRKTGTIYPRCVDSFHTVFCVLYNLDRRCKA